MFLAYVIELILSMDNLKAQKALEWLHSRAPPLALPLWTKSDPLVMTTPTESLPLLGAAREFEISRKRLVEAVHGILPAETIRRLSEFRFDGHVQIDAVKVKAFELEDIIDRFLTNELSKKKRVNGIRESIKEILKRRIRATYPFTIILLRIGIASTQVFPNIAMFSSPLDTYSQSIRCAMLRAIGYF
jgi:hypothetical protein